MSSFHHIMPSSHHMMMCHVLQSLLDRPFPVSGYLSGKYHALFIIWSFSIMRYHLLSHTMSYAPIFTHWTNSFPMTTLSFCLCWFIRSHYPLHFLKRSYQSFTPSFLPLFLIVVLFMGHMFVEFCHSHTFVFKAVLGSVAGAPQLCNLRISSPFCAHHAQGQDETYSEYPLHYVHSPSTLGHCSNLKAYLE